MTVKELADLNMLTLSHLGENAQTQISVPFCCDLLSIAMGRAPSGCAWVTVMANINTIAVATLTEAACIILAEGVTLDAAAKQRAIENGVTIFETELPVFDAALAIWKHL